MAHAESQQKPRRDPDRVFGEVVDAVRPPGPAGVAEALLVDDRQPEGECLQRRNRKIRVPGQVPGTDRAEQCPDRARRAGACRAVDDVGERYRLPEDEPAPEKRLRPDVVVQEIEVGAEFQCLPAGDPNEVLPHLEDTLGDRGREDEVPAEVAETVDVDCRPVGIGGKVRRLQPGESEARLADPLGADHNRVPEGHREVLAWRVAAAVPSDQRAERRVPGVLPGAVPAPEGVAAVPRGVIEPHDELLPFLGEREDPAVLFEDRNDFGVVARDQRRCDLAHPGLDRRRPCGAERVNQLLLRLWQGSEERLVGQQRDDLRFVAVQALVRREQEGLVALDRPPGGCAALRSCIGAFSGIEVVAGLESAVPQDTEQGTVELVRAALCGDIDRSARGSALFRRKRVPVDLELLNGFLADGGAHGTGIEAVVQAVDHEGVAASVRAAYAQTGSRRGGYAAIRRVGHVARVDDGGCEEREVEVIPPVDRKVLNADGVDVIRLLHALGLDRRAGGLGRHDDKLLGGGEGELGRHRRVLPHAHFEPLDGERSETLGLNAQRVDPRVQVGERELAGLRRQALALDAPVLLDGTDGGPRDRTHRFVENGSAYAAGVGLGLEAGGTSQQADKTDGSYKTARSS